MGKKKKDESRWMAFIQDDEGDVTRGPAESFTQATKRVSDAASSGGDRFHRGWTEEVK